MILREALKIQLERNYAKPITKIWNQKNQEMIWDKTRKLYVGKNSLGQEIVTPLQHTRVPIFTGRCPIKRRKGNVETECNAPNFIPIFHQGEMKCQMCGKKFTPQLSVDKTSVAYPIWINLDNEITLIEILKEKFRKSLKSASKK